MEHRRFDLKIEWITDLNSPEIAVFTGLNEKQVKRIYEPEVGLFICESIRVIERALLAGYEPVSFFAEEERLSEVAELAGEGGICYAAKSPLMREMAGYPLTGGVLCAMKRKPLPPVEEFLLSRKNLVILDDIENPTNVGAIFRNAAALGADGIILTDGCADPLYRRAARVSMGAVFQVAWTFSGKEIIELPHRHGFVTYALALSERSDYLDRIPVDSITKKAIVLGNEDHGISESVLAGCDHVVEIPMKNGVDSLNVAAASAVAFWEILRTNRE